MDEPTAPSLARGAYGFRVLGLPDEVLAAPVPADWPPLRVVRSATEIPAARDPHGSSWERRYPEGSSLRIDAAGRQVTFFVPDAVPDEELVHPWLSPAAIELAARQGHAVFHAGAFLTDSGAWGLLSERGGGKSTTLASLAVSRVQILTDDVLVLDRGQAFAGPRCIDLRPAAADYLGDGSRPVRGGSRRRLALPPIQAAYPLRGLFFLSWNEDQELIELTPSERLAQLTRFCRPEMKSLGSLLELAALPAWRLCRPASLPALEHVRRQLLEAASG